MLQILVDQWDEVVSVLGRLRPSAQVRPADGWTVVRPVFEPPNDIVGFDFGPAVFNVPERATHVDLQLYIVVEGRLRFRRDRFTNQNLLVTESFDTRAAYFRSTAQGAHHIYGSHYEFTLDQLGHPVFHSQMRSYAELWAVVREQYGANGDAADLVKGILQTVRVPTAQMDVFSFFLQLCADHLLSEHPGPEECEAFYALLEKSSSIRGAGYQAARLVAEAAQSCYRARHWYPVLP